jgi:NitT/TauT family transport system substrate-binding protein
MARIKPSGKIAIIVIIALVALGGLYFTGNLDMSSIFPDENSVVVTDSDGNTTTTKRVVRKSNSDALTINVGVVTWGGYAGGQYFNEGFAANESSRFYKDYGFYVDFKILNDFDASRNAWKNGDVDLLWATTGSFSTEAPGLAEFKPEIIMQADWSRGGDAIVVRKGINNVNDLKGKTIAVAPMTPSHTFFLNLLDAAGLKQTDVKVIEVANAIDAAAMFKNGQTDCAIVWSPDDISCIKTVKGSKILQSTKQASNIIADVFIAKKSYIDSHRVELTQLVEGWMIGSSEINTNANAKNRAVTILSEGLKIATDEALGAINNVRLTTYGDNVNFFGLNPSFDGVTGEKIYSKMSQKYKSIGYLQGNTYWRTVANPNIIRSINLSGPQHNAEGVATFSAPTPVMADTRVTTAVSTKQVTVSFPTGSALLDENAKYIIDKEFLDIAQNFANSRIRVAGNSDNTGGYSNNVSLSKRRAQAVATYLATEHNFDRNRFVVIGNGPDNPVASNATAEGRAKNRRTDFELISE